MKKEISYMETIKIIGEIKKCFESQLEERLDLIKIGSPIFVKKSTGLQDDLTGKEKPVSFEKEKEKFEIVHSLSKWKREALGRYKIPMHKGIYTEMKGIKQFEEIDEIHSLYVEQWDWEKVIDEKDRSIEYLKETVSKIYKSIRQTLIIIKKKYPFITLDLPKKIFFITSQELEDLYSDIPPEKREYIITKKQKAVFIIGIGGKLKSGKVHDTRNPDYDDWKLDGDLLIYDKVIDRAVEISSMAIRVDKKSLIKQLEATKDIERKELPYHKKILEEKLPYTIGGGIGESRVFMLILGKKHIAEVQASSWDEKTEKELSDLKIL